jgi:hypothetical protein
MPLALLSPDEMAAGIILVEPDLLMHLRRNGVSDHWVATLGKASFTSLRKFQMFGDDLAGVTEACGIFNVKREEGIDAFSQIASIKAAWTSVKILQTVEEQHRAEKKRSGVTQYDEAGGLLGDSAGLRKIAWQNHRGQAAGSDHHRNDGGGLRVRGIHHPSAQ